MGLGPIQQAEELFREFSGHEPGSGDILNVNQKDTVLVIGELIGLPYETTRDGKVEKYFHRFKATNRPVLAVSHDGKQIYILAGGYEFTDRGFVG